MIRVMLSKKTPHSAFYKKIAMQARKIKSDF